MGIGIRDEDWYEESDRVHWFRAEAEFFRWLEQFERKHFEFHRLIRSFRSHSAWWAQRGSETPPSTGLRAFAYRQSDVYFSLERDAVALFAQEGHTDVMRGMSDAGNTEFAMLLKNCVALRETFTREVYLQSSSVPRNADIRE